MESNETEALNYLLTELNRVNYSFNSAVNLGIKSSPAPISQEMGEEIQEPGQLAQSGLSYLADEDISRLVAIGLDEF
jgi:hypothetical protein